MRKLNQKGLSLIEVVIAMGLLGFAAIGLMRLQTNQSKMKRKSNIDEDIQDKSRIIKAALANRAICTKAIEGRGVGDTILHIKKASVDPNDFQNIIESNKFLIKVFNENNLPAKEDLSAQTANSSWIEKMEIIEVSDKDYLEVTFNRDPRGSKKIGPPTVKKRFLLLGEKDPVTEKYINCYGENTNLSLTSNSLVCASMGGTMIDGNCQYLSGLVDTTPANCGGGGTYKIEDVDGKLTITCEPCVEVKHFIRWECEKKVKGMNWINVCYYKTGCRDHPEIEYGKIFWEVGGTSASGQDTGSKKNCKKKRRKCFGEP